MEENKAKKIAKMLGGSVFNSGGGIHLVIVPRKNKIAVISSECICEYTSEDSFQEGELPLESVNWQDDK